MGVSKVLVQISRKRFMFRENLATAATCHYQLLTGPTEFLITLKVYGSARHFRNFCR